MESMDRMNPLGKPDKMFTIHLLGILRLVCHMGGLHGLQNYSGQMKSPEKNGILISHPCLVQGSRAQSLDIFNLCLPLALHKEREFQEQPW